MMASPLRIGLTGSIGMGKSTTAAMFRDAGIEVWDADEAVSKLYGPDGLAVPGVAKLAPSLIRNGEVDREALREWVSAEPGHLKDLESIVHPLVADDRAKFLANAQGDLVVFDIPLLFELGSEGDFDAVVVVTVPSHVQRERVLKRPGMTTERFAALLERQMPDAEKRARADYVIRTVNLVGARSAVHTVIRHLRTTGPADTYARDRT